MRSSRMTWLVLTLASLLPAAALALPAFPGAEGFGSDTVGGRGGQVIEVTNLNPDGPGSLREAVETSGPRIIVFRTGGTIELTSPITVREPYATIAGQTAPGDGICIKGAHFSVATHDVIVRGLRVRVGDLPAGPSGANRDGIGVWNQNAAPYNVIYDHCSVSWAVDENVSTWYSNRDITFQWCLIGEALRNSIHPEGAHSMGLLVGDFSTRTSIHHNLFVHNNGRNPRLKNDVEAEVINNVVYNWVAGTVLGSSSGGPTIANVIANHYKPGVDTGSRYGVDVSSSSDPGTRLYVSGNIGPGRETDSGDDWLVVDASETWRSLSPVAAESGITTQTADEVFDLVLDNAGAITPLRDAVDARLVQEVRDGTGAIIDSQNDVGGWPSYAAGTPPADADHDGMPDAWESARSLNPNDPTDSALDRDGDGYSNVEEYINSLIPLPGGPAQPSIRVTFPNGGEQLSVGSQVQLTWTSAGGVGPVQVAYSIDDGLAWTEIAASAANTGALAWTVPAPPAAACLLRVSEATDGDPSDVSDATFEIVDSIFSPVPVLGDRQSYTELNPSRWSVVTDEGDLRYFLNTSDYDDLPTSRMGEMALVVGSSHGDFTLRAQAKSADFGDPNNSSPDLCLVFGHQDADNYYYAMFNGNPGIDELLFRVVGGVRETIGVAAQIPLIEDGAYHQVEVSRSGAHIEVRVDGQLRIEADDSTFGAGGVGVGSFNDSVYFDDIEVLGTPSVDGGIVDAATAIDAGAGTDAVAGTDAGAGTDAAAATDSAAAIDAAAGVDAVVASDAAAETDAAVGTDVTALDAGADAAAEVPVLESKPVENGCACGAQRIAAARPLAAFVTGLLLVRRRRPFAAR